MKSRSPTTVKVVRYRAMNRFVPLLALMLLIQSGCSACYTSSVPARPAMTDVIVADHNLEPGITIQEVDIRIVRIPKSDLPPHTPRKRSDVIGHKTLVPIAKGQFIFPSQLN